MFVDLYLMSIKLGLYSTLKLFSMLDQYLFVNQNLLLNMQTVPLKPIPKSNLMNDHSYLMDGGTCLIF
jgi:hypothetical protein